MKGILALCAVAALASFPVAAQDMAGDAEAGAKVFNKCKACHVVDKEQNRVGPYLHGVIGRTAGAIEGYNYSDAMQEAGANGLVWDEESLAEYLAAPRDMVKGTRMAFAGLKSDEDIANVIAYMEAEGGE